MKKILLMILVAEVTLFACTNETRNGETFCISDSKRSYRNATLDLNKNLRLTKDYMGYALSASEKESENILQQLQYESKENVFYTKKINNSMQVLDLLLLKNNNILIGNELDVLSSFRNKNKGD